MYQINFDLSPSMINGYSTDSERLVYKYLKGDNLAFLRADIKSQKKQIKHLKKKSLWSRSLEEVLEKLVEVIHFLHLEISNTFGSADGHKPIIGHIDNRQRLGPAGLALHYANIVLQIDTLVARSSSMPVNTRDSLYQNLRPNIKLALRSKLPSFHVVEEIIPQSVCSRYGLAIGASVTPFVRVLVWMCYPVAFPISKLLDYLLGHRQEALFRRAELKTLVNMHGNEAGKGGELTHDETTIIAGALELSEKTASDAMTPISESIEPYK